MKPVFFWVVAFAVLAACAKNPPVDLSNQARRGTVNIDGEPITVFRQEGAKWAAYGGEGTSDPARYIVYRKERAIELKSGCRIDRRLSGLADHILVASVKCG
jgi:hypothetical protein